MQDHRLDSSQKKRGIGKKNTSCERPSDEKKGSSDGAIAPGNEVGSMNPLLEKKETGR